MSYDPDYSPFPESRLELIAKLLDRHDSIVIDDGDLQNASDYAAACRNAIACHDALRERCLIAELDRDQARHALAARSSVPLGHVEQSTIIALRDALEWAERGRYVTGRVDVTVLRELLVALKTSHDQAAA